MFVICEGIDRSGKSTLAELYKAQGYEVVHMSAPDKKYNEPGYSGPSYLDDILDMLMQYDGKDVFWDRSWYGEFIWPHVYGRKPMLSEDDIEVLQEFEERNQVSRILMVDPDQAGHWKRCVDNKEPLTQSQFRLAGSLYTKLAHKHNFVPKQLSDYSDKFSKSKTENAQQTGGLDAKASESTDANLSRKGVDAVGSDNFASNKTLPEKDSGLEKLEKANAISAVLSKRIIKQRGESFDELEGEITNFLKGRLDELLGGNKAKQPSLSETEVQVLKLLAQRFMEKDKAPASAQKELKQQRR